MEGKRQYIVSDKIICCLPYQISRKQGVKSVQLSGFTPSFHLDSPGKIDYDKCNQFYARPGGQTGVCVKNISIMIKPASSLCNMRCRYCFYADITNLRQVRSYGIMSRETTEKILENIRSGLQRGDQINFAFQGGEPALAGLDFYRHFVNLVEGWDKSIKVNYALQTNGLSLDEQWCRFLARHHFLVGISLDILPACHAEARKDEKGQGTYQRVMDGVRLMEQHGVEYNVLCTLTREAAKYPQKIWKAITKQDFKWVQFTPCLGELSGEEDNSYALTPQDFASFYIQLFSCWLDDFHKGAYRSIKLIDDLVNYLAYQIPTSCGINGKCQPQLIVEADGSVFPCDFYCLDEYLLGNFREQSLEELFLLSVKSEMRSRERRLICEKCPYEKICGGGCKRMQKEVYCGAGDGSCGMRSFLDYSLDKLQEIARQAVR